MILALTSKTLTPGQIYDQASNVLQQKLSQITGVGDVSLAGAALPAVRIELNPARPVQIRHRAGRCARRHRPAAGANSPKGGIEQGPQRLQVYANDNASQAADYQNLIVAYRNNAAVRLQMSRGLRTGSRISAIWASPTASPRCWSPSPSSPAPM